MGGQNRGVSGSVLPAAEAGVVSALLGCEVRGAEAVWNRSHVVRLFVGADRSVILKRRGEDAARFGVELAALEYLNGMPVPVAPRLVGADAAAGLLVMEDLGPGASLADSLLAGDRDRAAADLVAYAEALAAMHAWSRTRPDELAGLRARYAPGAAPGPTWLGALARGREPFLGAVAALGLAADGVAEEIGQLPFLLNGPGYLGLVHGDACPDNTRILAGGARIFDFETSGWGPIVLDAAYLLAPFPSCWCFARLPAEVAGPAMAAYRAVLSAAGLELGPDWEAALAAAVATWVVARGRVITKVLAEDEGWGTTTLRPRLLTWLGSFADAAGRAGVLPRLRVVAVAAREELARRWPGTAVPDYPALAGPGSMPARVPEWWQPEA
jgi:Ser/Thr protein kinase RdoA (MazF antagonist)